MPKAFLDCVKKGGKVITKRLDKEHYIRLCKDPDTGKWVAGEKKKYKRLKVRRKKK